MLQPYRLPVFNELAARPDLDFNVLLLSIKEANRQWKVDLEQARFNYKILPSFDLYIRALDYGLHFNRGVAKALNALKPEVVVGTGYTSPAYLQAQGWAKRNGAGYVLWSGSTEQSSRIGKSILRWSKSKFVRRCDACLAYGSAAKRALVNLGANPDRIVQGTNTVDVKRISQAVEVARSDTGFAEWRNRFPERTVLFVGQMIPRKGVEELIEAFQLANQPNLGLVLVGDGPKLTDYKERFGEIPNLFWEGYLQSEELTPYYAASDVLVMPSAIEVWGLVVNEAMAAGLPVVATTCSGATEDLIEEGVTGYPYESGDRRRLAELLESVANNPDSWKEMGRMANKKILEFTPARYAEDFVRAVKIARDHAGGRR
jgi:glycosyltransferase involved in cell wall biosynthesis